MDQNGQKKEDNSWEDGPVRDYQKTVFEQGYKEKWHNPKPITVTEYNKYPAKEDPPLVSVSVTNPFSYIKAFIKRILRNEGIIIRIKPLTAILMVFALSAAFGTGFNVAKIFFPNSSPILHRSITLQGVIQKSESGKYYLSLPDSTLWTLKPKVNIEFENVVGKQVLVKGNMTAEANLIEVSEVLSIQSLTAPTIPMNTLGTPSSGSSSAQAYPSY